ncbi:jeltraxin-like isoform X2 [Engystomops pustulosus]|uniref:jeltraxin-like isoform X2 n=1 Tax=Engystomops pustulosus TaxID=76066 RepID=UPI003AFA6437
MMKGLVSFFFLLAGCHQAAGVNTKTILLFPEATSTNYVSLKPTEKVLHQITVCLRSYTDLTREHSLFSLATPNKDNAFLIYFSPPNNISISINNEDIFIKVDPDVYYWKKTCVTWDSTNGLLQLWINNKRYPRRVTKTRSPIGPQMSVVLGQEQDSYGGGFDINQSFLGEMCDVNMWDSVLPETSVRVILTDQFSLTGNIYNWNDENFQVHGPILVLKDQYI